MNFFESYFRAAENLSDKDRLAFYDQLFRFYFNDEEGEVKGSAAAVWEGIKPVVIKSKNKAKAGEKGGKQIRSKSEANRKQTGSKSEANENQIESHMEKDMEKEKEKEKENTPLNPPGGKRVSATTMIEERNMSSVLESATKEWVQYKSEMNKRYKPTGLRNLLTEIQNNANEYGDAAVADAIHKSIANGWAGIVWDLAKRARSGTPDRFDAIRDFLQEGVDGQEGVYNADSNAESVVQ